MAKTSPTKPMQDLDRLRARVATLEAQLSEQQTGPSSDAADFLAHVPIPLHSVDANGTILWANRAELSLLGYSPMEYIGQHITTFHTDPAAGHEILRRLASGETLRDYPAELRAKNGAVLHVLLSSNAQWRDGSFSHTRCATRDITLERQIADRLHQRDEQLDLALAAGRMGTWEWNIATGAVSWSASLERLHGREPGTFAGNLQAVLDEVHPADRDQLLEAVHRALNERGPYQVQYRIILPDGAVEWLEAHGRVFCDDNGAPQRMMGVCARITERKVAQQSLLRRLEQLHTLYATADAVNRAGAVQDLYRAALTGLLATVHADRAAILIFDDDGIMRFKAWQGISDEYRAAVEGHTPWQRCQREANTILVPDVTTDPSLAPYLEVFAQEGIRALAFIPLRSPAGVLGKFMLYYRAPHTFSPEECELAETIANHVGFATERRIAAHHLEYSEARLRLALTTGQIGVWEWNLRTHEVLWSDRMYEIHGVAPDAARQQPVERIREFLHPADRERVTATVLKAVQEHCPITTEFRINLSTGAVRTVVMHGMVIADSTGAASRLLGSLMDVTEQRDAAATLQRQAEELRHSNEALQQFASIASHDLQQPLRTISTFLELFARRYRGAIDDQADAMIQTVTTAAQRMRHLVTGLLEYAHSDHGESDPREVSATAVLAVAIQDLQIMIEASHAQITADPLPTVHMDETQLRQLFENILGNAIKYSRREEAPRIHVSATRAGKHWQFSIRDNGQGIPPAYAQQVFAPFRRLHGSEYEGNGIGLATCKRIIERHGGRIWVDPPGTEPGATVCFTVRDNAQNESLRSHAGKTS